MQKDKNEIKLYAYKTSQYLIETSSEEDRYESDRFMPDTLTRFSGTIAKGDNFCYFQFAFLLTRPLLKGFFSKKIELAPKGSKLFPFRVGFYSKRIEFTPMGSSCFPFREHPFQKEGNNFDIVVSP